MAEFEAAPVCRDSSNTEMVDDIIRAGVRYWSLGNHGCDMANTQLIPSLYRQHRSRQVQHWNEVENFFFSKYTEN